MRHAIEQGVRLRAGKARACLHAKNPDAHCPRRADVARVEIDVDPIVPTILLDTWYKLSITAKAEGGNTRLIATCRSLESADVETRLETVVSNYHPSIGSFGVATNRALARFAYLLVEEAP